jgi:putative flavoprotein involved in K+ transport
MPFVRGHGGPLERVWPADLEAAGVVRVYGRVVGAERGRPCLDDGRTFDVATVIWSTGFRPEFGWIELPATGPDGWPRHRRGVSTVVPGLYFVGLPFLHSAASPLLGGVGRDAAFVVARIAPRRRSLAIPLPLRGRAAG